MRGPHGIFVPLLASPPSFSSSSTFHSSISLWNQTIFPGWNKTTGPQVFCMLCGLWLFNSSQQLCWSSAPWMQRKKSYEELRCDNSLVTVSDLFLHESVGYITIFISALHINACFPLRFICGTPNLLKYCLRLSSQIHILCPPSSPSFYFPFCCKHIINIFFQPD